MTIYFRVVGKALAGNYTLCYTSGPKTAIKYYLSQGWKLKDLTLIPLTRGGK